MATPLAPSTPPPRRRAAGVAIIAPSDQRNHHHSLPHSRHGLSSDKTMTSPSSTRRPRSHTTGSSSSFDSTSSTSSSSSISLPLSPHLSPLRAHLSSKRGLSQVTPGLTLIVDDTRTCFEPNTLNNPTYRGRIWKMLSEGRDGVVECPSEVEFGKYTYYSLERRSTTSLEEEGEGEGEQAEQEKWMFAKTRVGRSGSFGIGIGRSDVGVVGTLSSTVKVVDDLDEIRRLVEAGAGGPV